MPNPTVFLPPYSQSGAPAGPPQTLQFGVAQVATTQVGNAANATGIIIFFVSVTCKAQLLGAAGGVTSATPFLKDCFEIPKKQIYTVSFNYDFGFLVALTGELVGPKGGLGFSQGSVQAIGEIFDQKGSLVGDGIDTLCNEVWNPIKKPQPFSGTKSLKVRLKRQLPAGGYFWKFSVKVSGGAIAAAGLNAFASASCDLVTAGGGVAPGPSLAGAGPNVFKLKSVTVAPNVTPVKC